MNKTDILRSIDKKTQHEYEEINNEKKNLTRAKSELWPHSSEYESKFASKENQKEFEYVNKIN